MRDVFLVFRFGREREGFFVIGVMYKKISVVGVYIFYRGIVERVSFWKEGIRELCIVT